MPRKATTIYRPGSIAPITAVYCVRHGSGHRSEHEVIVIRGEDFPPCRQCRGKVEFEVVHPASHITHELDFAGLSSLVVQPCPPGITNVRTSPRRQVDVPVIVEFEQAGTSRSLPAVINDLAFEGANIRMPRPIQAATNLLRVTLALPSSKEPLVLDATVRHGRDCNYGVEFNKLSDEQRSAIRTVVARGDSFERDM